MNTHQLVLVVALLISTFGPVGDAAQVANISGTWNFSVDMGSARGTPTFVFKQQGERLTGTVRRTPEDQGQKVSGTVKGNAAAFGFEVARDGGTMKATYRGKIESATRMTGKVDFSGALSGSGTWIATKK